MNYNRELAQSKVLHLCMIPYRHCPLKVAFSSLSGMERPVWWLEMFSVW